ncbi:hypothetical protein Goari_022160, partial [Gossypium aridum]|nr:hypothetical protein [Gossypium aridum]
MERGLTNLLLEEGEEEGWQVDMAGTVRAMEDDLCMVGSFLTTSGMACQFGNFIGVFLDYDMKATGNGYRGFLRIRLGHSKSFFSIRILHGRKELSLEWDLPIWASPRMVAIGTSCWLWEEGPVFKMGDTLKSVYSGSSITQANIQGSFQHVDMENVNPNLNLEVEDSSMSIREEFWNIDWLWRVEQSDAMKLLNWNVRGL